jgi:hypothetical protein
MSFSQTVETVLAGPLASVKLSANDIEFIQRVIIAKPEIFNGIAIGTDGTVTVKDIPKLVLTISNLYTDHLRDGDINVDIISIIEFTVHILIDTLPINEFERTLLMDVLTFSIELLKKNLPIIEKYEEYIYTNCYNWTTTFFSRIYNSIRALYHRLTTHECSTCPKP